MKKQLWLKDHNNNSYWPLGICYFLYCPHVSAVLQVNMRYSREMHKDCNILLILGVFTLLILLNVRYLWVALWLYFNMLR